MIDPVDGIILRPAVPGDAPVLAELVNMAGEGLPLALWTDLAAPGQDPWQVGRARAARDTGSFSWRNAEIAERGGAVAGTMILYPVAAEPERPGPDTPAVFLPLIELEALAPGTLYINILAVHPAFRRQGIAARLLAAAAARAPAEGLSLIVSDANAGARAFYAAQGFAEVASRPVVPLRHWQSSAQDWLLLRR